jgi:universal stress protein E
MEFKNVFVVYDPTREKQPALERAALIAGETGASLQVYACIYSDISKSSEKPNAVREQIEQQREVMQSAVSQLVGDRCDVSIEVEWDKDWCQAAVRASIRGHADVVLKSSTPHTVNQRVLNRTADWTLIRECLCPVMLVKQDSNSKGRNVVAAIDIRADSETYEHLNERIISFSRRLIDNVNADVHFINAHAELSSFPDRNALIKSCGVDSDKIHIQLGEPEDVIVENAKELNASLVIVGNAARSGFSALVKGNTVEKIIDRLECDVLSMP